jgi:hypothetical protein
MIRPLLVVVLAAAAGLASPGYAQAASPKAFKNCTALNAKYKHGVALPGARDKTTGKPVKTFKVDRKLYQANTKLDRDKDRVACEKR